MPANDVTAPCEIVVHDRAVEFPLRPGIPVRLTLVQE